MSDVISQAISATSNDEVCLVFTRIDKKAVVRVDGVEVYREEFPSHTVLNERIPIQRREKGQTTTVEFDLINKALPDDAEHDQLSSYHFVFWVDGVNPPVSMRRIGSSTHTVIATYRYVIVW